MKSQCEICNEKSVFERTFFKCTTKNNLISLCETHNREMFLMGEESFWSKYPIVLETRKLKLFVAENKKSSFNKDRF